MKIGELFHFSWKIEPEYLIHGSLASYRVTIFYERDKCEHQQCRENSYG